MNTRCEAPLQFGGTGKRVRTTLKDTKKHLIWDLKALLLDLPDCSTVEEVDSAPWPAALHTGTLEVCADREVSIFSQGLK